MFLDIFSVVTGREWGTEGEEWKANGGWIGEEWGVNGGWMGEVSGRCPR